MNKELFMKGAAALSLPIDETCLERLMTYSELLKAWNQKINLTAITDDDGIAVKHFLDSVLLLKYIDIKSGVPLADIGTGGGFPGLPLKILRSDISLTLIDSQNKRINFLNAVKDELSLRGVNCVHGRAEELSRKSIYRETFDVVTSRAVANMTALSEYCLPFAAVGGVFGAVKSESAEKEILDSRAIIGTLGGKLADIIKAPLPESGITRIFAVVEKIRHTPEWFPRAAKKIKSRRFV